MRTFAIQGWLASDLWGGGSLFVIMLGVAR